MSYTDQLKFFHQELSRLSSDRERIERQINNVLEVIGIIQTLAFSENEEPIIPQPDADSDGETGFTGRIRALMKANPNKSFTALKIRSIFAEGNPPDHDPKITLIHIHNTLKRLHRQGEVAELMGLDGKAYRWRVVSAKEMLMNNISVLKGDD